MIHVQCSFSYSSQPPLSLKCLHLFMQYSGSKQQKMKTLENLNTTKSPLIAVYCYNSVFNILVDVNHSRSATNNWGTSRENVFGGLDQVRQTCLLSYRGYLEAWNFVFGKYRYYSCYQGSGHQRRWSDWADAQAHRSAPLLVAYCKNWFSGWSPWRSG